MIPLFNPNLPQPQSPRWPARTTGELVSAKPSAAEFVRLPRTPICVVLDDVRSLANVGLIFRVCDALRAERLFLCGITGHPPYPDANRDPRRRDQQERALREINRTAVMAIPYVPWEYRSELVPLLEELRGQGRQIVAVEQAHGTTPYSAEGVYAPPVSLVFGHERAGLSPLAIERADVRVELPVYGMANSLNVAMSVALVGYEVIRQHRGFGLDPL